MKRAGAAYKDLDDLAPLFDDQDELALRFYALRANRGGSVEELVTLALSSEVGLRRRGDVAARRPRIDATLVRR